jgi:glycerol-3-phosphate acyltransferase PlsX
VGLLNIGEESTKGNELAVAAHQRLARSPLSFVGNIEGRDVLRGAADVVVCDGFTGNILLKFSESIIGWLSVLVRESVSASGVLSQVGPDVVTKLFARLRAQLDYAEYGGAPLLGVDGVCIIAHGSSSARAVKNAIRAAVRLVNDELATRITSELAAMEGESP